MVGVASLFQLQLLNLFKYLRITVAIVTRVNLSIHITICVLEKQHSIIYS